MPLWQQTRCTIASLDDSISSLKSPHPLRKMEHLNEFGISISKLSPQSIAVSSAQDTPIPSCACNTFGQATVSCIQFLLCPIRRCQQNQQQWCLLLQSKFSPSFYPSHFSLAFWLEFVSGPREQTGLWHVSELSSETETTD